MAEELTFISGSKEEQYLSLLPQVRSLIEGEVDLVANLANVAAALKEAFDFFWVGFYLVKQDQLVLGPFQGPVHAYPERQRSLRYCLAGGCHAVGAGCGSFSGTYCLQFVIPIGNSGSADKRR